METGLLLLRLAIGGLLIGHGTQKLFGWFGGYGLGGTGEYLAGLGFRPGRLFAALSGLAETGGGALLTLGLMTPLGAAAVIANMIDAARGHTGKGVWNENGGWELPLIFGVVAAALGFLGAGDVSLDAALGWDLAGNAWGAGALAAGVAGGLATRMVRPETRRVTAQPSA